MLSIASLWLPILVSTVAIWVASSIVWMVLPWHRKDYRPVNNEEAARNALKGLAPGQYHVPYCASMKDMKNPEIQRKLQEGPVATVTVMPSGPPSMGRMMTQWVLFLVFVGVLIAYVTTRTLAPGTEYLEVFRVAGVAAWLIFGASTIQEGIWFGRPWRAVFNMQLDAIIYSLVAAGIFASMWPAAQP